MAKRAVLWVEHKSGVHFIPGFEYVNVFTTVSVIHGQYDARPAGRFPALDHHHPLASTQLYCLTTEGCWCKQERYMIVKQLKQQLRDQKCDILTFTPTRHTTECKENEKPLRCIIVDWHSGRLIEWLHKSLWKQSFSAADFTHHPLRLNPTSVTSYLAQSVQQPFSWLNL